MQADEDLSTSIRTNIVMIPGPNNDTYKCNILFTNHSHLQFLPGSFGFIPETFIISFVIWVVLLILFAFLRKTAWDYGRLALVQKTEQRWMQLFYSEATGTSHNYERPTADSAESTLRHDKGFCSWIKAMFTLKDDQIMCRNGLDAIQYLSFQRHIIFFLIIVCVICMVAVLPTNTAGHLEPDGDFGRTTLSNLEPEDTSIWLHIILSSMIVPLAIFVMKHFLKNALFESKEISPNRVLMITHIPKIQCTVDNLLHYFRETYPDCGIIDIDIAFDVRKLTELYNKRQAATQAKLYCELQYKETNSYPQMLPRPCGRLLSSCCPKCPKVDAFEFYSNEEASLIEEVETERSEATLKPLGIAFVTFKSDIMSTTVYKGHQKSCKGVYPYTSDIAVLLKAHRWVVSFAPSHEDIIWEHLSTSSKLWYLKAGIINLALFLLFIFLTTPAVVLNYLNYADIIVLKKLSERSPLLSDFASTLLLLVVSVLLPVILRYADQFMNYWTRSARNHCIMLKTYVFLLFMVIILPLLQLTSVKALLVWSSHGDTYRWKCVFMSGNGAFFVNYVITASLIGSALELIRFPDLIMYMFHVCISRSIAEQAGLRRQVLWEFEFGVQYAWFLLIFTVTIVHCLVVPMIVPFGLFCLIMKHLIDRYNIYFVYMPSKINRNILTTAINFVFVAIILMQICLFFFLFVRNGWSTMSIMQVCICIFTTMFFVGQVSFHWFLVLSPIAYQFARNEPVISNTLDEIDEADLPIPANIKRYMPKVLQSASKDHDDPIQVLGRYYGTNEESVPTSPDDFDNDDDDDRTFVIKNDTTTRKTYERY